MWDPPRPGVKHVPCIGRQIPTHCSTKEALNVFDSQLNWSPDAKSWFIGKDPDAGKDWGQEEKGAVEDEMVGWQHQFNGPEFEQNLGNGEGQGSLVCCSPWGCKELDATEWQNNDKNWCLSSSHSWQCWDTGCCWSWPLCGHSSASTDAYLVLCPPTASRFHTASVSP